MVKDRKRGSRASSHSSKTSSGSTSANSHSRPPPNSPPPPKASKELLSPTSSHSPSPSQDLRKEYRRLCKFYSSEPLDIVAGPLEKVSFQTSGAELDLRGKGLRGVDCIVLGKLLGGNSSISTLNLSDCLLLPQGFASLLSELGKNNVGLKILVLRGNNIQGQMVESLTSFVKMNSTLEELILEWNAMGASTSNLGALEGFLAALSGNKGIQYLDLRNNQIPDEAGAALALMLKRNGTMKTLDLRWNSLGVKTAKGLCLALEENKTLLHLQLGGNFLPEDVTKHISTILEGRKEKEAIISDYKKRTTLLTSRLQRTESHFQDEIKNMMSSFQEGEGELQGLLKISQEEVRTLEEQLEGLKKENTELSRKLGRTQEDFASHKEKEAKLILLLKEKDKEVKELEGSLRQRNELLNSRCDSKLSDFRSQVSLIQKENDALVLKVSEMSSSLTDKEALIQSLQERMESIKQSHEKALASAESRVKKEKESWLNWKAELESEEKRETQRLQEELQGIQKGMQAHIKSLETKKAEAEEKVSALEMRLLTSKTEGEESLSKLRSSLTIEYEKRTVELEALVNSLKKEVQSLELEDHRKDALIGRLQSDLDALQRRNEGLAHSNKNLDEELRELRENMGSAISRAKQEAKEATEIVQNERKLNSELKNQILEMQEQVAVLTMRVNRAEKERKMEGEYWTIQLGRKEEELIRMREEDMRRAKLLHDAFQVYMRSTSAATGLPIPREKEDGGGDDK